MNKCQSCGVDFDEFPDMKHPIDECPGPECTCYEFIGSHEMGCPLYGKAEEDINKCKRETDHAEVPGTGFCRCTHVMYS